MYSKQVVRASDSPLVQAVTHWTIGDDAEGHWACPDGLWDLLMYRGSMGTFLLLTGQTTKAVGLPFLPGDEVLTISFKASTYLTKFPAADRVDGAQMLTKRGARFELGSDVLEIPRFDNVEDLVNALERRSLVEHDELVEAYLAGRPLASSLRSLQRHFQHATGMAPRAFHAIARAQRAADWLRDGRQASQVAFDAGYSDQAHLSRSLKTVLGRTPSQIQAEGRAQVGAGIQDR
jgi:AraC-like DNA-binding protein